jgi:hypothetical protein
MNWFSIVKNDPRKEKGQRLRQLLEMGKAFFGEEHMNQYINKITNSNYLEVITELQADFNVNVNPRYDNPQVHNLLAAIEALRAPNLDPNLEKPEGFGDDFLEDWQ